MALSPNDQRQLDMFVRWLKLIEQRKRDFGETREQAVKAACMEVYGDEFGEGSGRKRKPRPRSSKKNVAKF